MMSVRVLWFVMEEVYGGCDDVIVEMMMLCGEG
jgi:hypothetical protein